LYSSISDGGIMSIAARKRLRRTRLKGKARRNAKKSDERKKPGEKERNRLNGKEPSQKRKYEKDAKRAMDQNACR